MIKIPVEFSVSGLARILQLNGIDLSGWGKGEARTVEDLLNELKLGESILRIGDEKISRVLRIVKMIVTDQAKGTLLEDYQILTDGRRKDRRQIPGGKIGVNETPTEALKREMREELGLEPLDYYVLGYDATYVESKPSKSYPNLNTVYEIHPARIILTGKTDIPDGFEFTDGEDGKKLVFCWSRKPAP